MNVVKNAVRFYSATCFVLILVMALLAQGRGFRSERGVGANDKYMGTGKCKLCHKSKKKGNQYEQWEQTRHPRAFETLGTEEAKKIAAAKGLGDPQTEPQCLKCHVTAYGGDEKTLDKKFDPKLGVQCEACHGPGKKHTQNRLMSEDDDLTQHKDAMKEMPPPAKEVCWKCHIEESPTVQKSKFWDQEKKQFKIEEAWKEIVHPNPMWREKKE